MGADTDMRETSDGVMYKLYKDYTMIRGDMGKDRNYYCPATKQFNEMGYQIITELVGGLIMGLMPGTDFSMHQTMCIPNDCEFETSTTAPNPGWVGRDKKADKEASNGARAALAGGVAVAAAL